MGIQISKPGSAPPPPPPPPPPPLPAVDLYIKYIITSSKGRSAAPAPQGETIITITTKLCCC